jgi:alpha-beta hydrolase superfamily lysophospholipase
MILRRLAAAALALGLFAGVVYATLCVWFAVHERSFIFYPMARASVAPEAAGLKGVAEVTIATEDGERLYGWWTPPARGRGAVVLLTGKGVVLSDYAGLVGDLAAHGFGVVGVDYRGNAGSTGVPSERGLGADARAAYDFARSQATDAKIAVIGESLGTGIALALAHDRKIAGVVLNSPYASVRRLFEMRGLPLPYRLLMTDPLDSEAMIGKIGVPVMILHSTTDHAIPIAEARRLYAAAKEPKTMIEVPGANHAETWFGPHRERALAALAEWTRR